MSLGIPEQIQLPPDPIPHPILVKGLRQRSRKGHNNHNNPSSKPKKLRYLRVADSVVIGHAVVAKGEIDCARRCASWAEKLAIV